MRVSQFVLSKQVGASDIGFKELNGILTRNEKQRNFFTIIGDIKETLASSDIQDFLSLDNSFLIGDSPKEFLYYLSEGYSLVDTITALNDDYFGKLIDELNHE
jgi:hypothetical protein